VKPLLKPLCRIAAPLVLFGAPSAFADESDIEGRWLSGDKSGWRDIRPIDGKPEGRARRRWSAACSAEARECGSRSQSAKEAVATHPLRPHDPNARAARLRGGITWRTEMARAVAVVSITQEVR